MAIVEERKPFKIGGSKAVTFPKSWTTLKEKVVIAIDRVGLVLPADASPEEVRLDVEKLLRVLEEHLAQRKEDRP